MKQDIVKFVSRYLTCQQVKVEHKKPRGLLQPLPIPEWKWEHVFMDFVTGLSRTCKNHDNILVVVDRLTKSSHFLPMKVSNLIDQLTRLHIRKIIRLHGIPILIVSYRDPIFTFRF